MNRGLSLIELVLVVGLMLIISGVAVPLSSQWYLNTSLSQTQKILVASFRKAQAYAVANKNNLTWGVCLTSNIVRLYSSSCSTPTVKDDFSLPSSITISGLTNITFTPLTGEPSTPQTITLASVGGTKTIIINSRGGFSY